jgi:hypothetical protein
MRAIDHDENGRHGALQPVFGAGDAAETFHSLHVDAHDETLAVCQRFEYARFQRAVQPVLMVAVDLRPFEELAGSDLAAEFLRTEEVIVHAIDFTGPRRARRGGYDAGKFRPFAHEPVAQRTLSRARRAGDHQQDGWRRDEGWIRDGGGHSWR